MKKLVTKAVTDDPLPIETWGKCIHTKVRKDRKSRAFTIRCAVVGWLADGLCLTHWDNRLTYEYRNL